MASYLGTGTSNPGDVCTLGKLGVGTSSPSATLDVVGNLEVGGTQIVNSNGYLIIKTSTTASAPCNSIFVCSSDSMLYFKDCNGSYYNLCE